MSFIFRTSLYSEYFFVSIYNKSPFPFYEKTYIFEEYNPSILCCDVITQLILFS